MIPVSYSFRSLIVRRSTSLAAGGGIALVVFVLSGIMMLAEGVAHTLARSGRDDVAVVLRGGSDAELSSGIADSKVGVILGSSQVARRTDGDSDGLGEAVVVIILQKLGAGGVSNVQIRGTSDHVYDFRKEAHIIAGRKARPGADECVIGRALRGRFAGLELGQTIELRQGRPLHVVGVFEAGNSSFESEVWADRDIVRAAFGREGIVQSVRARLTGADAYAAFKQTLENDRQLNVSVLRESDFYEQQSEGTSLLVKTLGAVVGTFFGIGAVIAAMITMYSAVASRKREIGTLRALGFARRSIMGAFLLEALLLALLGGAAGAVAATALGFVRFSMVNAASWSELVFGFEPTPATLGWSLVCAGIMGVLGGLFPALRAARMPLIRALKNRVVSAR